jgi:hypothetical protein
MTYYVENIFPMTFLKISQSLIPLKKFHIIYFLPAVQNLFWELISFMDEGVFTFLNIQ